MQQNLSKAYWMFPVAMVGSVIIWVVEYMCNFYIKFGMLFTKLFRKHFSDGWHIAVQDKHKASGQFLFFLFSGAALGKLLGK